MVVAVQQSLGPMMPLAFNGCYHGFEGLTEEHICAKFIDTFVHEFYGAVGRNEYVGSCIAAARDATWKKCPQVWSDFDKIKIAMSWCLSNGTDHILNGHLEHIYPRGCATMAYYFEQLIAVTVHKTQSTVSWSKLFELSKADKYAGSVLPETPPLFLLG
jgi:hypothetical protein